MMVESFEVAEDITRILPKAVSAIEFESSGKGSKIVRKTKEHIEAEKW